MKPLTKGVGKEQNGTRLWEEMKQQDDDLLQFQLDWNIIKEAHEEARALLELAHDAKVAAGEARLQYEMEVALEKLRLEKENVTADDEPEQGDEEETVDCPANRLLETMIAKLKVERDADHVWGPGWRTRPDKGYFDLR